MCAIWHIYNMDNESPDDVKRWFLAEVGKLWPVATGSLSLRKSPCVRDNCSACQTGEGHSSYVLYIRAKGKRSARYVPDALADTIGRAVENGRKLEELMARAGERYLRAIKPKG
jgi:hypothetical protein